MSKLPLDWHKKRLSKGMTAKTELVLNALQTSKTPQNVMTLMKNLLNLKIGSLATCHHSLAWLIDNGYAKAVTSNEDHRMKTIEISNKGKGYFDNEK